MLQNATLSLEVGEFTDNGGLRTIKRSRVVDTLPHEDADRRRISPHALVASVATRVYDA